MEKLFKKKCNLYFIIIVATFCFHLNSTFGNECRKVLNEKTVGLENSNIALEFDRNSGTLTRIFNVKTNGEYIKASVAKGNTFRIHINSTQKPSFIENESAQPDEEQLGGKVVDPLNCKLVYYYFSETDEDLSLILISLNESLDLLFEVKVSIQSADSAASMQLTVKNISDNTMKIMTAFPYISGIGLGKDPSTNLGVKLRVFGQSRVMAWKDVGDIYGRHWASQWNAVYEPSTKEAFGIVVEDRDLINKTLQRHPGGIMKVFYFDDTELSPNTVITYPETKLLIYKGDWKLTAVRYGRWFRENFKLRQTPNWLKEVGMFIGPWIPAPLQNQQIETDREFEPLPSEFNSFADFPNLYLLPDRTWENSGKYDLKEWAQYWEGVNRHNIYAAYDHTDGIYDFRKDLGGADKFREGVAGVEKIGRHVGLYVASRTVRNDSKFFKPPYPGAGTKPDDWLWMATPTTELPKPTRKGHQSFYMSPRNPAWQDYLAATIKHLLRQSGARYVRLDEFWSTFVIDYNTRYIKDPYNGTPEVLEFLKKVRSAIDEVDPNIALFTEGATDITAQYVDGTLCMFAPGPDISPMRLVIPEFVGFSYHLGQVDCALQGYVCAVENAANRPESWSDSEGEKKIRGYPEPPESDIWGVWPEKKLRWHELQYTFKDAVRGNDPVIDDPVAVGLKSDSWAGRMWKSSKYWLMVCGNRWAEKSEKPIKVKLSELPEDIRYAYEFDCETLTMQEVAIERSKDGIYVNTHCGFSAIFFPRPDCPPLIEISEKNLDINSGELKKVALNSFSPWRKLEPVTVVTCEVPGLAVINGQHLRLPGEISLVADKESEKGFYYFKIQGDCLPLKRWLKNL